MTKLLESPGSVLILFMRGYNLNPTSLAKQLKLSQATVRLLTLDKTKISVHIALRLAKFFDMKPEYWLKLQNTYDLAMAANNAKIKTVLQSIPKAVKPGSGAAAVKAVAIKAAVVKEPKVKKTGKGEPKPKTTAGKGAPRARAAQKQKEDL